MNEKPATYTQSKFNNNISDIISRFEIKPNHNVCVKEKHKKMVLNNEKNETEVLDERCYEAKVHSNISNSTNKQQSNRLLTLLSVLRLFPIPLLSTTGTGILVLFGTFILPRSMGENIMYPGFRLLFGTLYPGYASYKAIRTKNVKEYVSFI